MLPPLVARADMARAVLAAAVVALIEGGPGRISRQASSLYMCGGSAHRAATWAISDMQQQDGDTYTYIHTYIQ